MQVLKELLSQLNIPVAYNHFNQPTNPPFVVYRRYSQSNFGADDIVYQRINNYYIELYTEYKDTSLEEELETLLTNNGIFYNVESEDYLDDEKMYEIIYSINYTDEELESI